MPELKNIINYPPYSLEKEQKKKLFKDFFNKLTFHHYTKCKEYKKIIKNLKFKIRNNKNELNKNLSFEKLRIVDLLQGLIKMNCPVHSILTDNGWLEFDTLNDYEIYTDLKNKNILSNIIQLE